MPECPHFETTATKRENARRPARYLALSSKGSHRSPSGLTISCASTNILGPVVASLVIFDDLPMATELLYLRLWS